MDEIFRQKVKMIMNKNDKSTTVSVKSWAVLLLVVGITLGAGYTVVKAASVAISTIATLLNPTKPVAQNVDFPPSEEPPPPDENFTGELKPRTVDLTSIGHDPFILLYGPIMQNGNEIARLITETAKKGSPIYLLIDSPGGSVITGASVVSAIEAAQVPVYTVCLQLCASMAAIIHQYGSQRLMVDRSFLMFHNARGGFEGSFPQILSQFNTINRFVTKMLVYIAKRSNQQPKAFLDKLASEVWIDAEDSLAGHYSDETVEVLYDEASAVNPPTFLDIQERTKFKQSFDIINAQ